MKTLEWRGLQFVRLQDDEYGMRWRARFNGLEDC